MIKIGKSSNTGKGKEKSKFSYKSSPKTKKIYNFPPHFMGGSQINFNKIYSRHSGINHQICEFRCIGVVALKNGIDKESLWRVLWQL